MNLQTYYPIYLDKYTDILFVSTDGYHDHRDVHHDVILTGDLEAEVTLTPHVGDRRRPPLPGDALLHPALARDLHRERAACEEETIDYQIISDTDQHDQLCVLWLLQLSSPGTCWSANLMLMM